MSKVDVFEVEGFEELNRKLKQLPDRVKRTEVIKIFRRLAKPIEDAYKEELPVGTRDKKRFNTVYPAGSLSKAVRTQTVPAGKVGGNPSIVIRPARKGKFITPYYGFMVTRKGEMTGMQIKKGASRKGKNTAVEDAKERVWNRTKGRTTKEAVDKTAELIQKQIDKLGNA